MRHPAFSIGEEGPGMKCDCYSLVAGAPETDLGSSTPGCGVRSVTLTHGSIELAMVSLKIDGTR